MSIVSFLEQISLSCSKNFFSGSMNPIFPAIGSMITAAISLLNFEKASFKLSMSLYGSVIVSSDNSSGMPGESGTPKVAKPEPAFTKSESTWP